MSPRAGSGQCADGSFRRYVPTSVPGPRMPSTRSPNAPACGRSTEAATAAPLSDARHPAPLRDGVRPAGSALAEGVRRPPNHRRSRRRGSRTSPGGRGTWLTPNDRERRGQPPSEPLSGCAPLRCASRVRCARRPRPRAALRWHRLCFMGPGRPAADRADRR